MGVNTSTDDEKLKIVPYYNNIATYANQTKKQQKIDDKLTNANYLINRSYAEIKYNSMVGEFIVIIIISVYKTTTEYDWWTDHIRTVNISKKYKFPIKIITFKEYNLDVFKVYFYRNTETEIHTNIYQCELDNY